LPWRGGRLRPACIAPARRWLPGPHPGRDGV